MNKQKIEPGKAIENVPNNAIPPEKPEISLIDKSLLKSQILTVRGVKVMLNVDLAEIYGYSTKAFNKQGVFRCFYPGKAHFFYSS